MELHGGELQSVARHWSGWLEGSNALLTRELRVALRSPRVWMLIALYISMLGALVLAQFPFDEALTVPNLNAAEFKVGTETAAQRGHDLLIGFVLAQAFLVWLLVPSLASGALAQEREQQTLEPLLLSPLSPLQIVWGKAAGVLATAGLLLLGTLPLTSLCFLLGGVSPGEVAGYYALLLTLAFLFTGIGLFCAATWTNPLRATMAAYGLSLCAVPLLVGLCGPGSVVCGMYMMMMLAARTRAWLWRKQPATNADSPISTSRFHPYGRALILLALLIFGSWLVPQWLGFSGTFWLILCVVFIAPYGYFVSRFILENAAQAMARRLDPIAPRRERVQQWQRTWRETMGTQAPIAPAPSFSLPNTTVPPNTTVASTWAPIEATPNATPRTVVPNSTPNRPTDNTRETKATYNVKAFLPDNRNPIFARDLRHGLGGRAQTFFRTGYVVVIATELLLIFYLMFGGGTSPYREAQRFADWSRVQLILVMLACAWLGSRAIAPEREGQTLSQLLSIPLPAANIIGGKIASVLFFSGYVMLLGVPLTFLMPLLSLVPWPAALAFLLIESGFALLCAAWGLACSLWCHSVRRALGCALGGVATMLLGGPLLLNIVDTVYRSGVGSSKSWNLARTWVENSSPTHLIARGIAPKALNYLTPNDSTWDAFWSIVPAIALIVLGAAFLLAWSSHIFRRLAQTL